MDIDMIVKCKNDDQKEAWLQMLVSHKKKLFDVDAIFNG